jgi:L-fuculose-phosphate aldolase
MATQKGNLNELRQSMLNGAKYLVNAGVMSHSLHGNMSIRIPGTDSILLTSNSTFGPGLRLENLPLIDLDGNVLDGKLDPTSAEIVEMHTEVYKKRADIGSVIHTHSPHATVFAVANQPIDPCIYEGLIRQNILDPVPVAQYGPRGSKESVNNILKVINPGSKAVLLQNHGVLAFDRDLMAAAKIVAVLEEAAELAIRARLIGQPTFIPVQRAREAQNRAAEYQKRGTLSVGARV